MKIGFTGTRSRVTREQAKELRWRLERVRPDSELHHGDCVGADTLFDKIAKSISSDFTIVIHPPEDRRLRAYCRGDIVLPVAPYLERNQAIVADTDILIAVPNAEESTRSGTWWTVRWARQFDHPILIIWPTGIVTKENYGHTA